MEQSLRLPVAGCSPEELSSAMLQGAFLTALPSKADAVRARLPAGSELTVLHVHPVGPELHQHLARYQHSSDGILVGIASRWAEFQRIAHTMLIAAGLAPESLLVRDATQPGWERGLEETASVVCDAALACELPSGCLPIPFTLLAASTLDELRLMESSLAGAETCADEEPDDLTAL